MSNCTMLQPRLPLGHSLIVKIDRPIHFRIFSKVCDNSLTMVINIASDENVQYDDMAKHFWPYTFTIKSKVIKGHLHYYGITSKNFTKHYGDYTRQRVEHDMLKHYVSLLE